MFKNNRIWEFNRGEWTEAYVFLKLLGNGRIYGATDELKRDDSVYIDIINVLRYDKAGLVKFEREAETVEAKINEQAFKVICCKELTEKADFLYKAIKSIQSSNGKLSVPETQEYLESLQITSPKAPPMPEEAWKKYGKKSDIIITSSDCYDRTVSTEGYSIKSHLGSASTLFNASAKSGIIYKIEGCTEQIMHELNAITSEKSIFKTIKEKNLRLEVTESKSPEFARNLSYIETTMADVLGIMMLVQVGYLGNAASSKTKDIIQEVAKLKPVNMVDDDWYEANFKDFLFSAFSGMTATEKWDGRKRMTGGYIDVGKDGEILYFRAVSNEVFTSYLYNHTVIDRPSRGANKDIAHAKAVAYLENREPTPEELYKAEYKNGKKKAVKGDWGYVYQKDGSYFIAINFQVRFE